MAQWESAINIGGSHRITGHPALGKPGMLMTVELYQELHADDLPLEYQMRVDGGLQIGSFPTGSFTGALDNQAAWFKLHMPTFAPLPAALPDWQLPSTTGTFVLDRARGNFTVAAVMQSPSFTFGGNVLAFTEFQSTLDIWGTMGAGDANVIFWVDSVVWVGGLSGFGTHATGSIDTTTQVAQLNLDHEGGWSPVGSVVSTPAFSCALVVGPGSYLDLHAEIQFVEALKLIPGAVQLIRHPESTDKKGASLTVSVHRDEGLTPEIAALPESTDLWIRMDAALKFGKDGPSPLPEMGAVGYFRNGDAHFEVYSTDFQPLPGVPITLPGFVGDVTLTGGTSNGYLEVHLETRDATFGIGGVIEFVNMYTNIDVETVLGSPETQKLAPVQLRANLRVGGENGFIAATNGADPCLPTTHLAANVKGCPRPSA